ncbi:MAG TPA: endolytic transglycosylase MltG [Galbitalea sp.]
MADEPTWDDLFGEPLTPTAQQPPVQQPPAQQQPPVQTSAPSAPVQNTPTYPAHSVPTQSVPAPNVAPPAQQQAPTQAAQPTQVQPPQPFVQQAPAQPTYVSQLPSAPTRTHAPQVDDPFRPDAADDSARRGGGRGPRNNRGGYRPEKPKRKLTWLWVLIVLVVLGGSGAGIVYAAFGPQIRHVMGWEPSIDYTSTTGNGQSATVTILPGQIGADVANSLAKAGVTKTSAAFYDLLLKQKKAPNFEPGTYKLGQQISAKAALAEISDPKNRVVSKVVIPEGFNLNAILTRLNQKTGTSLSDLKAQAKNYTQFGLPAGAPSLEGFLFPATYSFDPGTSAKVELQTMVTRMNQSLKSHGVAPADELKVLTMASIIQKESGSVADDYKVSRVFANRIAAGMPLQSDATVSYGAGSKTIATTAAQRADASNLYNTYAHAGLPVGPIASPGDKAIDAALHPVAGPWIYFVLVNGDTGESVFSTTAAGQAAATKQWQAWLKAHPGYGQ